MAIYRIKGETLENMADKIRILNGVEGSLTTAQMDSNLGEANTEVSEQAELIAQIASALEGKAGNSPNVANVVKATYKKDSYSIPVAVWFEENMSWEEYLNSRYNICGDYYGEPYYLLRNNNNKLQLINSSLHYISIDGTSSGLVKPSDKIIVGMEYICYCDD